MDRLHQLKQRIANQQDRTFSCKLDGRVVWVKRTETNTAPRWRWLSALLAKINRNPLYIPTHAPAGAAAIADEARRLRHLAALGVPVPEVIAAEDDWIALADAGTSLKDWLRDPGRSEHEKSLVLNEAAIALARLHQNGRWHGRPALRDMAWDGERICFLDFEEDPARVLSQEQCQMRDLLVFVHGLYRYLPAQSPLIAQAICNYKAQAPERIWQQSVQLVDSMWVVYRLSQLLAPFAGKDVRQAYYALRFLRSPEARRRSRMRWLLLTTLGLCFTLANHID
ncbi:lipopolysaccharide kinase InaA family protein [Alkalimonas sp. MEB108]|uniref:Lipopolysaccharide kinase InaA family protein n=1 Tax=Alkalimonas cellulosilytica TaxID=3058395 RepID=A0ABU7J4Z5_9GAMM|nr:lipopolysaccharide kinase InaA family protein [Alkalimonas sp. MEB108]MEE2001457.1 lipopolysaccharide kinase InaA family protein [Alkalimonas sp. MEB108]